MSPQQQPFDKRKQDPFKTKKDIISENISINTQKSELEIKYFWDSDIKDIIKCDSVSDSSLFKNKIENNESMKISKQIISNDNHIKEFLINRLERILYI